MKFFFQVLVVVPAFLMAIIASSVVEAAAPERSNWYYPFWRQGCTGCAAKGNVLPWCVRLPVQNLLCTSTKPVTLPACIVVPGAQVDGAVDSAKVAIEANGLSSTATVSASQVTCNADNTISSDCMDSITLSVFPDGVLPSSVQVDANQVSGTFPDTAFIAGGQITGPITEATIDGDQITGSITEATIDGDQITGSITNATIDGTQITGSITTATIDGALISGRINGSQVSTVATANNLQCPTNATANSMVLPSCYAINATAGSIIGNIPGGQITGIINATGVTFDGELGANACSSCLATVLFSTTFQISSGSCVPGTTVTQSMVAMCPTGTSFASKSSVSICPTWPSAACTSLDPVDVTFNSTTLECIYTCTGSNFGNCGGGGPSFTTPSPFACV